MSTRPLALTPGEPAGIGPDLVLQVAAKGGHPPFVTLADIGLLAQRRDMLGVAVELREWVRGDQVESHPGVLNYLPVALTAPVHTGVADPANAQAQLDALNLAVDGCLDGTFSALVTGPMQKSVINEAGIPFSGHTEYLAERAGGFPVMMLATGKLRVGLVTTHLPLRQVADAITADRLRTVIEVMHTDLVERFGILSPRIAVLGLNPHAGETGHLGREEIDIIHPVLETLRQRGMNLSGPLPADTAFTPTVLAEVDAVLAMYHDQGLPVLKFAGFGQAVNITLGLPIIRTSVDHGTALSLAGTGKADMGSLQAAIAMAASLAGAH